MPNTRSTTDDLSRRLSQGDRDALAELFTAYRDRLGQMLHFRAPAQLAGRLGIDDLLQESYLAAERRIDAFEHTDEHGPFVWLRLITLQTLTDQCRRHLAAQRRDAGRELSIHARIAMPGATTASMASLLIDELTSPSGVAMRAEATRAMLGFSSLSLNCRLSQVMHLSAAISRNCSAGFAEMCVEFQVSSV